MKNSAPLHLLIRSLTKSEKGYFKKQAMVHGSTDQNYLELFDALAKMDTYDEERLAKKFQGRGFMRQPAVARNYLYNQVLKSLETYHSSVDAELHSFVNRVGILFEKGLYTLCEKELQRAKKLAAKYERFMIMIELLRWEMELLYIRSDVGRMEQEAKRIHDEMEAMLVQVAGTAYYSRQASRVAVKIRKDGYVRNEADLALFSGIVASLPEQGHNASSYQSKYYYYMCHIGYYQAQKDPVNSNAYAEKMVKLMEEHPHRALEKPRHYMRALRFLAVCQTNMGRYDTIPLILEKYRNITTTSETLRNEIYYSAAIRELDMYLKTAKFAEAMKLIKAVEIMLNDTGYRIVNKPDEALLYHLISSVYFIMGDLTSANLYLNKILNTSQAFNLDLLYVSRIRSLIIQFELGKQDLLEYAVRSTYRFLYKRKSLYGFEKIVLEFIRKQLPGITTRKQLVHAFGGIKSELELLMNDPYESSLLHYFDIIRWLESKVENKSFREVLSARAAAVSGII
jgi:uncharacterized protein (UPF0335 family)